MLIPYEFLADTDTTAVGRSMTRLIELGYSVWFRPRVDDDPGAQLRAYRMPPDAKEKVRMAPGPLDEKFLSEIDIVAGTMTTLIYEMIPANKVIWYLDTPYRHLEDLVDEGLAHRIHLDDLRPPGQMSLSFLTPTRIPPDYLFGKDSLETALREHLLPMISFQKTQNHGL